MSVTISRRDVIEKREEEKKEERHDRKHERLGTGEGQQRMQKEEAGQKI